VTALRFAPARLHWLEERPKARAAAEAVGPAVVILVLQGLWFRDDPVSQPGLYLYGIVLGLVGAVVAVGMALVYRANRILNFAQGELGLVPTVLALDLIAYSGLPYVAGALAGLGAAIVTGALVEFLIIRRFFRSARLILTVATIGLSQLLTVAALAVPMLWGHDALSQQPPIPFDLSFEVSPITFSAGEVIALVVAPLALVAVALFLHRTDAGVAIRASAERSDRAALLGVPVKRLQMVVWSVAAALSFVGVFLKAGIVGLPYAAADGFGTTSFGALLAALTALTLGRFRNLAAVAVSAVALGILEQEVVWHNEQNPAVIYVWYAVIIVVALLVRRASTSRADHDEVSSWQAVDDVRPIPRELRGVPEVVVLKWGAVAVIAVALALLPEAGFMDSANTLKAAAVVVFAIIGISIVLLTGWAGQVTLGQMGFVAVGAACGGLATEQWRWDLSLAILVGGAAAAVVAVIVGLPALRVRGLFLGVTTLAFAVTASYYLLNPQYAAWIPVSVERTPLFGRIDLTSQTAMYELCLACFALVVLAMTGLRRSRSGRAMLALRENERAARSYGIDVTRAKLSAFALSGFFAGVAGCLYVHLTRAYSPDSFAAGQSFAVFTSTVVGGLGSVIGGVLGAVFSRGGTWFLTGNWQLLPSAVGVLVILLVLPGGFSGGLYRLRDRWLRGVARRRGIVSPSLVAVTRATDDVVIEHAEHELDAHDEGEAGAPPRSEPPAAAEGGADRDAPVPAGARVGGNGSNGDAPRREAVRPVRSSSGPRRGSRGPA
jgi:branched-chain amino acid transport system permease protein